MTASHGRLAAAAVVTLALSGCVSIPNTYAPPMERRPVTGYGDSRLGGVIGMGEPRAPAYILSGLSASVGGGSWRWAHKRAELRFSLARTDNARVVVDFTLPEEAFRTTGPLTFTFFVNGRPLDTVRYNQPGLKHFEKPVPADWLRTDAATMLAIEVDKLFKSPRDGWEMGFILNRAGFLE
jgi:hypothetical protein